MKRALLAAVSLIALATLLIARGKSNVVHHYYDQTTFKVIDASEGSCRHHMRDHPMDMVVKPGGPVHGGPELCN
jgi:hypothetical protein